MYSQPSSPAPAAADPEPPVPPARTIYIQLVARDVAGTGVRTRSAGVRAALAAAPAAAPAAASATATADRRPVRVKVEETVQVSLM